jgi:hypothetical protein
VQADVCRRIQGARCGRAQRAFVFIPLRIEVGPPVGLPGCRRRLSGDQLSLAEIRVIELSSPARAGSM